jgi:predicted RNA binding protein YcfA (HicA-like mRNA interferase family)
MRSAEIIKRLEADGWLLRGVRGGHISVPHPKKELGVGLVHKLLKQAGLKG